METDAQDLFLMKRSPRDPTTSSEVELMETDNDIDSGMNTRSNPTTSSEVELMETSSELLETQVQTF